jgi:Na+/H+-dicarboxylate symporter
LDRVSLTSRVLIALILGIGAGLLLSTVDPSLARPVVAIVEPAGTLFINAIRMTVIPLVASSLIVGLASSTDRTVVARVGGRGLVVFIVLTVAAGLFAALVAPPILDRVALDPAAAASLRASASTAHEGGSSGASALQTPAQWLIALVPANPIGAAVDGAMLPLILFSLVFGVTLLSVDVERRERVTTVFRAIAESMLVVVRWLLVLAPIGVFALALPLVARLGLSAVGALATYVAMISLLAIAFTVGVIYPAAVLGGRVPLRDFARAVAPAQGVAGSSRSSLAALPALIEAARDRLHFPPEITGFFLPLANAVFRVGATLALTTGALFVARLYGVPIGGGQLATIVVTSMITSFSIPGIPGGSIIAIVPVLTSAGLPVEGMGILLGVDTIPDIFRTILNVTGHMAAATIAARGIPEREAETVVTAAPAGATVAAPVASDG